MAQSATVSAREMAARLSRATGRPVSAKAVRAWVRDNIARYDDGRYTAHGYTPAEQARITAAWTAKGERAKAQTETSKPKPKSKGTRSQVTADAVAESADANEA